ncbi:hypothetical protein BO00_01414, partial [Mycobacterium tuberculosis EAS054]
RSRQTQNPERGRKRGWWASWRWGLSQVVRPKTPRGDGNLHPESPYARNASNVSSDPKPREGTETRNPAPHPQLRHAPEVVRPKTPRGDGNSITLFLSVARLRVSSDPKPREGTETLAEKGIDHESCVDVVRPKTPRGDGNNAGDDFRCCGSHCRQTQNPERGRKRTPAPPLTIRQIRRRQTQNPERGRKLAGSGLRVLTSPVVVRPKTPRGDGNPTTSSGIQSHGYARSSDPKPREGTETCIHSSPTRRTSASRQTQNPERGRKLVIASRRAWRADCRQTQNHERGRKLASTRRRHGGLPRVLRPKTPRGDGNTIRRRHRSR